MFHNRIASDLRSHFSTVGPSPQSHLPAASDPGSNPRRLLLLPSATLLPGHPPAGSHADLPADQDRRTLLQEFCTVSSHRVAAFLAEAAVLVLVLGILDRFLASNRFNLRWVGGAFLVSLSLLAGSIALELSARLWLPRLGRRAALATEDS